MKSPTLQDLPVELLAQCFLPLKRRSIKDDLGAVRLTSKLLLHATSPLLLDSVRVYITSKGLDRLEEISKHPIFSRSIKTIKFSLCFYDAKMANDLSFFAECRAGGVYRNTECYERGAMFGSDDDEEEQERRERRLRKGFVTYEEWSRIRRSNYNREEATESQLVLLAAHEEYRKRFEDQESVKRNNAHVERISKAISRLTALRSVTIEDKDHRREDNDDSDSWFDFSDKALGNDCLRAVSWKGPFNNIGATPPVELIPQLFQALSQNNTRPTSFDIEFSPPTDLRALRYPAHQLQQINTVLSQTKHVSIKIYPWARQDSLAVNNDRPHDELSHLGALTTAFCNPASLHTLSLDWANYPAFYEVPQISLAELLPINGHQNYPHLHRISLHCIPMHMHELTTLLTRCQSTLRALQLKSCWLLSGTWADTLDALRASTSFSPESLLESVSVNYPHGAEFGDRRGNAWRNFSEELVGKYILGADVENPIRYPPRSEGP